MMREHLNQMRQAAHMATQGQAQTRIGIVTSFDQNTYSAKVLLQPENKETGWLPCTSAWTGNGWGLFCPPSSGDMVQVEFQEGGQSAGFIVGRFFNDIERPLQVPSGEWWLVHKQGAFIKLTNDAKLLVNSQVEIDVTTPTLNITVAGNANLSVSGNITSSAAAWNHTGDVNVSGTVTASTDVVGGGKSLKTHKHSGVVAGGAQTGTPV
ncbi:MAG: phage baseplate assembly protein V [Burkholderiaceae bacterium]|nr:phage baseplate assembly protein V [Burkholderiaceae bacterium]